VPYRDDKGIPVRGAIRRLLMDTSVDSNGAAATIPLRAAR
jgi:hypothetical protein